jgi:phenylpropionate dioxygenase-like ring-hydroxylating dioxygenase large terminal subunit
MEAFVAPLSEATVKGGEAPLTGRHGLGGAASFLRTGAQAKPLDRLLQEIEATADLPLAQGRTLPAAAYTSEEFLAWETQHVLGCDWLALAHVSQIPQPGDFLNLEALGEPLIVVHGKDGVIRVLSRVCPHRAMDIMPPGFGYDGHGTGELREGTPGCGHTRLFLCPYHHWTFDLDGTLKGCPEMQQAEGFCRDQIGLTVFRSEVWQGFVFVNFSGEATPLSEQYGQLENDITGFAATEMEVVIAKEWDCPFNWKVLVENFMEGYHHLGAHCKTLQMTMPAKNTWTEAERAHSIRVNLPFKDSFAGDESSDFAPIPTVPEDQKRQMSVYLGFPNFLLFTGPDRLFWYRIDPVSSERSKLLTTCLLPKTAREDPQFDEKIALADQMLVDFHLEDMEVCTAVQRGFQTRGYQQGRLSHLEMPIWLIQRYLGARIRGVYPTQDRPAAPSQK